MAKLSDFQYKAKQDQQKSMLHTREELLRQKKGYERDIELLKKEYRQCFQMPFALYGGTLLGFLAGGLAFLSGPVVGGIVLGLLGIPSLIAAGIATGELVTSTDRKEIKAEIKALEKKVQENSEKIQKIDQEVGKITEELIQHDLAVKKEQEELLSKKEMSKEEASKYQDDHTESGLYLE